MGICLDVLHNLKIQERDRKDDCCSKPQLQLLAMTLFQCMVRNGDRDTRADQQDRIEQWQMPCAAPSPTTPTLDSLSVPDVYLHKIPESVEER